MRFQYFEIRPCVDTGEETHAFLGEPEFHPSIGDHVFTPANALAEAEAFQKENGGELFWTIYGRDEEGLAMAVGDFNTFEAALEIMNAILAPMTAARDKIWEAAEGYSADVYRVADDLDDVINQCSNGERL